MRRVFNVFIIRAQGIVEDDSIDVLLGEEHLHVLHHKFGEPSVPRYLEADMTCNTLKLTLCSAGKRAESVNGKSRLVSLVSKVSKYERFRVNLPCGVDQSRPDVSDDSCTPSNLDALHS